MTPHEGASMAPPRWLAVSHASLKDAPWRSQSVGDCIKPRRTEALQAPVHMHARAVSRNPPEMDSGGGAISDPSPEVARTPWPTARAVPTHDRMPLHHLRCPAAGQPREAAPQRDRYNQNRSYPRGGWVDLYSGGCSLPHAVTPARLWRSRSPPAVSGPGRHATPPGASPHVLTNGPRETGAFPARFGRASRNGD